MLFKPLRFLVALGVCASAAPELIERIQLNSTTPERRRPLPLLPIITAVGVGISATSFIWDNLPTKTADFKNGDDPCWYTCHKDQCTGTRTNQLSDKLIYYNSGKGKSRGCCFWKSGSCHGCCLSLAKYKNIGRRMEDSAENTAEAPVALPSPVDAAAAPLMPVEERRRPAITLPVIFAAMSLAASVGQELMATIPRNPDFMNGEDPCWWTCKTDQCEPTRYNPLSTSLSYYPVNRSKGRCCAFWRGTCNGCCLSVRGVEREFGR